LDEAAVAWLTAYLQTTESLSPPVTVVVVSHDAAFLEAVATDVLLLAHGAKKLEAHRGSYAAFKEAKPEVHAYLTRRTDMSGNTTLAAGGKFTLTFPRPDRLEGVGSDTKSVLRCSAVTFAYPPRTAAAVAGASGIVGSSSSSSSGGGGGDDDGGGLKVVLHNVDCKLNLRSKVACLGGNGAGK